MENVEALIIAVEKHRKVIGTKWITVLLFTIIKYPVKFNKLRQVLPTISARTLSMSLVYMQNKSLIIKEDDLYIITKTGSETLTATLEYIKKLDSI